ncbi:MAG TPA: GntR family transcriptional regulator [Longimicrobiales bacterium]|nr:GntR family transcriptional regulator [Longimicrobiales bacterium]
MLPFEIELTSGESPYRQVVYAATRAVVSGELPPGAPFPSVRTLSQSLKINPNTAQKAVSELVRDGLLEVHPGVGTVVAEWGPATPEERRELLSDEVERLLVEARRLRLTLREVQEAITSRWSELFGSEGAPHLAGSHGSGDDEPSVEAAAAREGKRA